ncbi:uncharacterized protein LOC112576693 isoform X1 [Pomacea canaliculata]|uniref:uncharacterized protein LOC112576693 isoform X1 n=2 Tax=Pomacea canaliculata TaxID=400727 RepID=UPI000D739DE2|nr:uncharacterized protein LOC112576693 isoform X1 [Pomacea canaliculata]XP_025115127.1 uncharacterized protein LOC112576693 isoform X1 [Pomacea canaliculata]
MHHEVMRGHDAHLPDANQCFALQQGYPGIPYDAMVLTGSPTSYVDFHFSGEVNFRDLSLSFYVFPIGGKPQGTVLNYRCPSGNVIKMAVMESLFLVSFWDEYGVSVGVTAISDMLTSDSWNHVVVVRRFSTGNIQIYHNGQLLEDLDDDFPNGIRLPVSGVMRLGRGQDEDEEGLHGRYTCLQVFAAALSRDDVANVGDVLSADVVDCAANRPSGAAHSRRGGEVLRHRLHPEGRGGARGDRGQGRGV